MKTHANEWNEVKNQGILVIAFYVILMAGFFIVSGNSYEVLNSNVPKQTSYSRQGTVENASDKSFDSPEFLSEKMMTNVYEALIPLEEASFTFSEINSIKFPSGTKDNKISTSDDNYYLTTLLIQKNKEVAKECNTYWNLKDCLKEESEQPLTIETWMTDDSFWHHLAGTGNKND